MVLMRPSAERHRYAIQNIFLRILLCGESLRDIKALKIR